LQQEPIELPCNLEAERAVIGAVLLENEKIIAIQEHLIAKDFYHTWNRIIFEAMTEMSDANEPIDMITLATFLQKQNQLESIGGVSYLSELTGSVPTAANVEHWAGIVRECSLQREGIKAMMKQISHSGNAAEMIASMEETAASLSDRIARGKEFHVIGELAQQSFETMEQRYYSPSSNGVTGIASGFTDLDRMTSGFQRSDLIIVAARPSVGKTAFALNIAQNVGIRTQENVAIFSLEMGAAQLVQRMVCAEGNVDAGRVRTGYLEDDDWERVSLAIGNLSEANIFIDDSPALTVSQIRAKCRRLKKERGKLGLILIDYLQLITGSGRRENRQQEVSEISRTLKQIARELDVPVIALSQLSRGVEQRQDKRPMMSDLRESGSLEQDADIVAFLYRDDYYDKESEKKNIIEIIIAKQRNGPVGTVELAFLKNFNKFVSLDRSSHEQKQQTKKTIPDMHRGA